MSDGRCMPVVRLPPSSRGGETMTMSRSLDCRAALIVLAASRGWSQAPQRGPAPSVTRAASKNWDPCGNCGHFGRSQSSFRRRHATQVKSSPVGSSAAENSASPGRGTASRRRSRPRGRPADMPYCKQSSALCLVLSNAVFDRHLPALPAICRCPKSVKEVILATKPPGS